MANQEAYQAKRSGPIWPRVLAVAVVLGVIAVVAAGITGGTGGKPKATIPAGTAIVATLESTVSTKSSDVGDPVVLRTAEPLKLDENTVIPEGIVVRGEVTHVKGGGRIAGAPELTLRFGRLEVDGEDYAIQAEPFRVRGKNDAAESAITIGGGAVVGGVVGAVAGSAAKGALIGAVLGTGVAVATDGDDIVLPKGTKLRVRLADPVTVSYQPPEADRQ